MSTFRKILCILCIILACTYSSYAQVNNLYTISTTIEFSINTDNIIQNTNYYNYVNKIIPIIKENKDNIDYILLIGSASPEGNYNANIKLANKRADKIYSYISTIVTRDKIIVTNDYHLFLQKTGYDESDYRKLRATYVGVSFKYPKQKEKVDTLYVEKVVEKIDTLFINKKKNTQLIFSIYNNILGDLLMRPNVGFEFYFNQFSFFLEGSFSNWKIYDKLYDIDFWHTGFRKYFNDNYNKMFVELYGRTGHFDTELFCEYGNGVFGMFYGGGIGIGYKFNIGKHWKISPILRLGFDNFKFLDYYSKDTGQIDVSFTTYVDGRSTNGDKNGVVATNKNGDLIYLQNKSIGKSFIDNSYNVYWFGPTYIGITIQRDFFINKKFK